MASHSRMRPAARDVLEALLTAGGPCDGLSIARAAHRRSATAYPILAALEDCGWVRSHWRDEPSCASDARCRVYRLTASGFASAPWLLAP